MQEFRIIRQNNNAKPFSLWSFDNFGACYCQLITMINDLQDCVYTDFYVFNDFFDNEYLPSARTKFKIECREVSPWQIYEKELKKKNYNKIIKIY